MQSDAPRWSWRRAQWAWKLVQADRAEQRGEFTRAVLLLDEATQIKSLWGPERVQRALLLLRSQRTHEAHQAFAALRDEFKDSDKPELQYLRHYCTAMLSMLSRSSGQWAYEAKEAKLIECSLSLKRRFPMVTIDEIHEAIPPKP